MKRSFGDAAIEVVEGDLTKQHVDAIVNAANSTLLGGGGVDGAIHRAGGPAILAECQTLGGCETGDAKITTGGNLLASHVIHTVGPVYRNGGNGEPELLARCHQRSLEIACAEGLRTVAFPAISCGVYGYPIPDAAQIAIGTVAHGLESQTGIDLIRFVLFDSEIGAIFERALESITEP
jgi:O-acetyl-ADP-ribose deacetylase (regulator of RNase III)